MSWRRCTICSTHQRLELITEPEILSTTRDGETVHLSLRLPHELEQFKGHFDEFPMLAGVVQVDWAIRRGRQHFALPANFKRLTALKFLRVIAPGNQLQLTLSHNGKDELDFRYLRDGVTVSSGRALFAD
jgi:3-hydroxymyristoyl/3-hydroxydecanoyl-(acyl carrier protein) dehydratase